MPITSDTNEPLKTSADSPDTLPLRGYSIDQLANFIQRQLGAPVWNLEVTRQQIIDSIQDALGLFSQWVPLRRPMAFPLMKNRFRYLEGVDVGMGIAQVEFVDVIPLAQDVFFAGVFSPAPLFRTGLDEYDIFLRWRKTWKRVTSCEPDWFYDEYERTLYVYNPIERYQAGVICFFPYANTQSLPMSGAGWVKDYATAKARFLQGDIFMKFSGAIPAPMKDIQLDAGRRDTAAQEMKDLKESLKGMSTGAGIWTD